MKEQIFEQNVVQQPVDSLNRAESYWVGNDSKIDRVLAIGDAIEDGEISWTQARIQEFRRAKRTLLQRLLKSDINSVDHPSGFEVQQTQSERRKGHLFTARQDGIDLQAEISRRMSVTGANIVRISDQKIVVEGMGVPVAVNVVDQSVTLDHLSNATRPITDVKALYRGMLETLPDTIAKNARYLNPEDLRILYELADFRRDRVRWASLTPSGGMVPDEPGQVGNAWMCVIPPDHFMMAEQQTTLSMGYDNAGINPYLSIQPYDMTHRWAGLGLVHELSHLRDAVLGHEPRVGRTRDQYLEGEHRAYSVERALAFAYSEGRLQQVLETVVREALSQGDPMIALNSLVNQRLPAISRSLDACIEPQEPKSQSELGLRQGLYIMLLGFEIARQMSAGNPAQQKGMEKSFIELIYEPTGHLPK